MEDYIEFQNGCGMKNDPRICSYRLKDDGEDEIRIPSNAVAYDGVSYGMIIFYSQVNGGIDVTYLERPGYYRRMIIISRQVVGGSERDVKLV